MIRKEIVFDSEHACLGIACKNLVGALYECPGETAEEMTEVRFEESIWTVPLLLGVAELPLGWFDSLFATLPVLLNLTMQSCFTAILLTRTFMGDAFETKGSCRGGLAQQCGPRLQAPGPGGYKPGVASVSGG